MTTSSRGRCETPISQRYANFQNAQESGQHNTECGIATDKRFYFMILRSDVPQPNTGERGGALNDSLVLSGKKLY